MHLLRLLQSVLIVASLCCHETAVTGFVQPAKHQHAITATTQTTHLNAADPWFVVAHVIGGASGAPIVAKATRVGGWYRQISLPSWTPPDRIFAPVWTLLYACMGLAVGKIYRESKSATALVAWVIHIVLNLSWAPIFFGMQKLRLGLVVNCSMWSIMVGAVLPLFYKLNPVSAYLLMPYLGWLTFATVLNVAICRLNPTQGGYNDAMLFAGVAKLQTEAAEYAGF